MVQAVARWRAMRADYAFVMLALIAYSSAGLLARLHPKEGPPSQRIHVRWAPDVLSDDRTRAEQALVGILFLIPLLPYGPYEEEFVENGIRANQVFYSELFHGRWMYWLNNLGFGAPMALGARDQMRVK